MFLAHQVSTMPANSFLICHSRSKGVNLASEFVRRGDGSWPLRDAVIGLAPSLEIIARTHTRRCRFSAKVPVVFSHILVTSVEESFVTRSIGNAAPYFIRAFWCVLLLVFANVAQAQNTISTVAGSAPPNNVAPTAAPI